MRSACDLRRRQTLPPTSIHPMLGDDGAAQHAHLVGDRRKAMTSDLEGDSVDPAHHPTSSAPVS
jgi:hypothetical protein